MASYASSGGEGGDLLGTPPIAEVITPPQSADTSARALSVASRLLAGSATFFFLSFIFAYLYLRSVNVEHLWRPGHIKPNAALGVVFIVCLAGSIGLTIVSSRQMKAKSRSWTGPAILGVVLGFAAILVQCIEYTQQNFGPTDGAYASVFCAWTGFFLLATIGTMYWLETNIATELRARKTPAAEVDADADIANADLLIAPSLDAATFFWAYLGMLGVLMYVMLYIV